MNRVTRLLVASGAGLTLALTASPAFAAPPTDPSSNGATVTKTEISYPLATGGTGTTQTHSVLRQDDGHTIYNYRDQSLSDNPPDTLPDVRTDVKSHFTRNENVVRQNTQYTQTYPSSTCRYSSNHVVANGETRTDQSRTRCK